MLSAQHTRAEKSLYSSNNLFSFFPLASCCCSRCSSHFSVAFGFPVWSRRSFQIHFTITSARRQHSSGAWLLHMTFCSPCFTHAMTAHGKAFHSVGNGDKMPRLRSAVCPGAVSLYKFRCVGNHQHFSVLG